MGRRVGAPSSVRSTSSARRGCHQGPAPRRSASARRWAQTAGWYGNACQRNQSRHHGAGESGRGLFHGRPHDGFGDSRKLTARTAVSSMVASSSTCPSARKMCSFSLVERAIVWRKSLSSFGRRCSIPRGTDHRVRSLHRCGGRGPAGETPPGSDSVARGPCAGAGALEPSSPVGPAISLRLGLSATSSQVWIPASCRNWTFVSASMSWGAVVAVASRRSQLSTVRPVSESGTRRLSSTNRAKVSVTLVDN